MEKQAKIFAAGHQGLVGGAILREGNINPIVMLLGAFADLSFFGIVGVVVGPLLLAFFLLLLQVYRQEYLGHPAPLSRAQILTGPPGE